MPSCEFVWKFMMRIHLIQDANNGQMFDIMLVIK